MYVDMCVSTCRGQQAVRRLPQRKCPTWLSTSSQSSLIASRLLKVRKNKRWDHLDECNRLTDWKSSSCSSVAHQWAINITVIKTLPYFPTEINRSYQMSSFVETKALEQLTKSPVEFVEYPPPFYWCFYHYCSKCLNQFYASLISLLFILQ